jgi:hypothetical protein
MQNEGLFIALDTVMMTICTGLQTFIHPGIFFPAMVENRAAAKAGEKDVYDATSTAPGTPPSYARDQEAAPKVTRRDA